MKYPQLVSMPSAVSDWLEEQLEARGIDAVVYTRYVLSLLYRDPVDIICPDQDFHFANPNKEIRRSGGGRKRFCRSSDYRTDADQLKRSAAVECLKSASDQKCGIESLVDELCEKLKEVKNEPKKCVEIVHKQKEHRKSFQDQAKQYYAAFPPLSRNASSPNIITLIPKWFGSPKKRVPRKQARSSSYEEKLHFKVESETMKVRSTGKSRYFGRYKRGRTETCDWDIENNNNNNNKTRREIEENREEIMYDDLPVDIIDLLDSPSPNEKCVEMMNLANMRDSGNKTFLQYGTNIISSIWSNDPPMEDFDNAYNTNLDHKMTSIPSIWSTGIDKENETNNFYESYPSYFTLNIEEFENQWNFTKLEKWSDGNDLPVEEEPLVESLTKLNHSKTSLFLEVKQRGARRSLQFETPINKKPTEARKKLLFEAPVTVPDEDLLNSERTHFRPINEKTEVTSTGKYANGTTFVIPNNVEKINFKRSKSGTLFLDEFGKTRKYREYKPNNRKLAEGQFTIKFRLNENEKVIQTEMNRGDNKNSSKRHEFEEEMGCRALSDDSDCNSSSEELDIYFPGDQDLLKEKHCTCETISASSNENSIGNELNCALHENDRPDSMMAELFGKVQLKCDNCNNESAWNKEYDLINGWQESEEKNIWNGGEVCMACLRLNRRIIPSREQVQLREAVTEDGEKLLDQLSNIQKRYMEEDLPVTELSIDINELIGKEWSGSVEGESASLHSGSFSFATRLQQDCLMQISSIPTLRSVTL